MTQPIEDPWPLVPKDQEWCTLGNSGRHSKMQLEPVPGHVWRVCPEHDYVFHRTCKCHFPKDYQR